MAYNLDKAACRLKDLRNENNYSQREMAKKLSEFVKDRVLDGDNGKNTVSQLENGARGITLDYAFAYADIFDVSLDYILGRTDDRKPINAPIKELTGLSDRAIEQQILIFQAGGSIIFDKILRSPYLQVAIVELKRFYDLNIPLNSTKYHVLVPDADFQRIIDGGSGSSQLIPSGIIKNLFTIPAKEALSKMVDEIAMEKERDTSA